MLPIAAKVLGARENGVLDEGDLIAFRKLMRLPWWVRFWRYLTDARRT